MKLMKSSLSSILVFAAVSLSYAQLEGGKPDTQPVHHPIPSIQDTENPAQKDANSINTRQVMGL